MTHLHSRVIVQSAHSLRYRWRSRTAASVIALLVAAPIVLGGQSRVTPPKNKYTPEQDVEIGQKAAEEVRQEFPVIENETIDSYLDRIGRQLVDAAPRALNHSSCQYSFTPLNLEEINA